MSWELRLGVSLGAALALGWAAQGGLRLALQRWRGRRAAARGARGERRARALLERAGYRVLAEQPRHLATLQVSGRGERYLLVPDFLCERHGRRYVADAKTGAGADPSARATRRQLLEYACAFGVQALLVDVPAGRIHRLEFGVLPQRKRLPWGWLVLASLALASLLLSGFAPGGFVPGGFVPGAPGPSGLGGSGPQGVGMTPK